MTRKIQSINVNDNINKYYSNEICKKCNNKICKVYGGKCKKYNQQNKINNIKNKLKSLINVNKNFNDC